MRITEYAKLAQRTASTKTPEEKIGHGCLGLIGEAGEVIDIIKKQRFMGMTDEIAHEKLIDEAGDLLWYIIELCTGLNCEINIIYGMALDCELIYFNVLDAISKILMTVCDVFWDDDIKKVIDRLDYYDIAAMLYAVMYIVSCYDIDFNEVMEHNITKLKKRYPEGFSAERSNMRYEHV